MMKPPETMPGPLDKKEEEQPASEVSSDTFDFDKEVENLIRATWSYIFSYTESSPMIQYSPKVVLAVLRKAIEIFEAEPTVLDLKGVICIAGDIQGQADTLISLFSTVDMPPLNTFLFLGNYGGQGFGPHECLLLLLALKVRYPRHIYLLKGNLEDPQVLKANDFIEGLALRGLMKTAMVWLHFERVLELLPWAVVISNTYFCVHGGIGPQLMKNGLGALRKSRRPATYPLELALEQECMWACYRGSKIKAEDYKPHKPAKYSDGSPLFGDEDINTFLGKNKLQMMIRSRQVVMDGVLNLPARMLTVWSAAAFLDNFRNHGSILVIDGQKKVAVISRIRVLEDDPKSLDDMKPAAGRNAIILC